MCDRCFWENVADDAEILSQSEHVKWAKSFLKSLAEKIRSSRHVTMGEQNSILNVHAQMERGVANVSKDTRKDSRTRSGLFS